MDKERDPALHEMDPLGRFSDRAADYARHRPDYPAAAIAAILEGLGDPSRLLVADVGAGTGISARAVADRGPRVVAVEPNAAMRTQAEAHPRVTWHDGTAERTGLESDRFDLVLCAQAFHWFRPREAAREFHRILKRDGCLVLVWNSRDRSDPLTRGYVEAIHAVHGEDPAERRPFDRGAIELAGFGPVTLQTFAHGQRLDLAGLIGRATSASYVPKDGPAFARLRELLAELFAAHRDAEGRVMLRYRTEVHRATRR